MSNLRLFKATELSSMPKGQDSLTGYVYAVEFGNLVKIGSTKSPRQRIGSLKTAAKYAGVELGKGLLTIPHQNYLENEKAIHRKTPGRVDGTELFNTTLSTVKSSMKNLRFDLISESQRDNIARSNRETAEAMAAYWTKSFNGESDVALEKIIEAQNVNLQYVLESLFNLIPPFLNKCESEEDGISWINKIVSLADTIRNAEVL